MNLQEFITYLILTAAGGYVFYKLYKTLFPGKQGNQHGCSPGCSCDAVKMRRELLVNKKK